MKLKIKTLKLNAILSSIEKGVGNIRVLPITSYMKIKLEKGELSFKVTDSINFLTYKEKGFEGTDGEVVVDALQVINLASKTTKEEISLEVKDGHLEIKGNGTYKVELNKEDEFPTYEFKKKGKGIEVDVSKLKEVFSINSSAIAEDMIMPCLTGYNLGKISTTTDGVKMCINSEGIDIKDSEILISQKQAELLKTLNSDKMQVYVDGQKMLFETERIEIFGAEMDDKDQYPDITELSQIETENKVEVVREDLVKALQRLSLFINIFENGGVSLKFNKGKLKLKDIKQNSEEELTYKSKEIKEVAEISVSIRYLLDLVSSLGSNTIELHFNNDAETPLIIKDKKVTQLLSVMNEAD